LGFIATWSLKNFKESKGAKESTLSALSAVEPPAPLQEVIKNPINKKKR
jgi:hypothetical protein